MNKGLSAQALTSSLSLLPLHGACTERSERVEREGVRQAKRRQKITILFQNETYLSNAASKAGLLSGIDKVHCKMKHI
jgi:hypothetical protein